jgi:beta-galactosidase
MLRFLMLMCAATAFAAGLSAAEKRVALVFDDGPRSADLEPLLALFAAENIPATFSLVGARVAAAPVLTRAIRDAGHEIANHSLTHAHPGALDDATLDREVAEAQRIMRDAAGESPRWYWPPYLETDSRLPAITAKAGLTIYPTRHLVISRDYDMTVSAAEILRLATTDIRDGSVILFHEWRAETRVQMPAIIAELRRQGCTFLTFTALHDAVSAASGALAQNREVTPAPRERIAINGGWRFHQGDPAGNAVRLDYDVRPEVTDAQDGKVADARPDEAVRLDALDHSVLKPWILPTANAFIKDPARHHVRPPGHPGGDVAFVRADFDDRAWSQISLPHDWAIAGPFLVEGNYGGMGRLPSWGIGWYRKKLSIPAADAGRSIVLEVDGAMSYATVWLNGKLVGGWPFGYSSWQVDLTPYVRFGGENQLAIRLDNPPASSRWYPGGGIYRNVWLTKAASVRVAQWGTHVTAHDISAASARVQLEVSVANDSVALATVQVESALFVLNAAGQPVGEAVATTTPANLVVAANQRALSTASVTVTQPRLWGSPPTQKPHRYVAVTTISQDGRIVDRYETRFGIRDLKFDPTRGVIVNGEPIRIQGVNQHHDLGALGAAFNTRAARRQLEILREMGCNAIRTAHNPPAPELLELTDAMGFLVVNESFDVWERKKTPLDFHLIFPAWGEADMRALVRRDRNAPSVIMWSIGNEVGEQYTDSAGAQIAKRLRDIVREEDPTRPVTAAMNWAKPDMPMPAELDPISLNYQGEGIRQEPEFEGTERIRTPPQYSFFQRKFPEKVIVSSESASAFSSRGIYYFPVTAKVSAPVRDGQGGDSKAHHVSSYELHAVDFGSSADKVFGSLDRHPYVAGEFVWTGWDYLGEPTPYYAARSSYCGMIDLAGFKKDRFYLYQARWRPELPMAHLLPHWTWPERAGQVTPVHVFTSGDSAEVFLNGRSLGRKTKGAFEYRLRWDDVVYEPGTVEVVAYKDGREWARDRVETTTAATGLALEADRAEITADGVDLAFVTVRVVDASGRTVPRADQQLTFEVSGAGEFVASDNGDPTNFEPFPLPARKAFSGLCMVIVRAKPGQTGAIHVVAKVHGLAVGEAVVTAVKSGVSDWRR